jgi:hypothetical protein
LRETPVLAPCRSRDDSVNTAETSPHTVSALLRARPTPAKPRKSRQRRDAIQELTRQMRQPAIRLAFRLLRFSSRHFLFLRRSTPWRLPQNTKAIRAPPMAEVGGNRNGGFKAEMRLKLPPFSISPDGRLRRAERPALFSQSPARAALSFGRQCSSFCARDIGP